MGTDRHSRKTRWYLEHGWFLQWSFGFHQELCRTWIHIERGCCFADCRRYGGRIAWQNGPTRSLTLDLPMGRKALKSLWSTIKRCSFSQPNDFLRAVPEPIQIYSLTQLHYRHLGYAMLIFKIQFLVSCLLSKGLVERVWSRTSVFQKRVIWAVKYIQVNCGWDSSKTPVR